MPTFLSRSVVAVALAVSVQAQAVEVRKLVSADSARIQQLGFSTALSGNRALIGAPFDGEDGAQAGAAYVFERDGDGSWEQTAKLRASEGEAGYYFAFAVALDGDRALIGTPRDKDAGLNTGAVFVFERAPDGSWSETGELATGRPGEQLGFSVALQGNRAVTGAPFQRAEAGAGLVFVFERDAAGQWQQSAMLAPSDGAGLDGFGFSVALSGDRILVGTREKDGARGQAYVFERDPAGAWVERARLRASDGNAADRFGTSLDLSGERALVGAISGDGHAPESGAAYVFERDPSGTWTEQAKLAAADGELGDRFGSAVALSGGRALIGAPGVDLGPVSAPVFDAGSAYAFELGQDGVWHQTSSLTARDSGRGDSLGKAVALLGDRALVGSPMSNPSGRDSGSSFVFDLEPLSANARAISVRRGGEQTLEIDAGSHFAGHDYRVLGSFSGTTPGIALPRGLLLPLQPDAYFSFTLTAPDKPPLRNPSGRLDANGHALARFTMPPGAPIGLIGREVNHAFVVFSPNRRGVRFVSNAQPLAFVP